MWLCIVQYDLKLIAGYFENVYVCPCAQGFTKFHRCARTLLCTCLAYWCRQQQFYYDKTLDVVHARNSGWNLLR